MANWSSNPQERYDESARLMKQLTERIKDELYGGPTRRHHIDCACRVCSGMEDGWNEEYKR